MLRGEIYYANLDPAQRREANKTRPVVIVSNNAMNRAAEELGEGVVTIVPLTSNTTRIYDFQVLLPALATGLPQDSKAQAEQIRSVDISRLSEKPTGMLPTDLMTKLDEAGNQKPEAQSELRY